MVLYVFTGKVGHSPSSLFGEEVQSCNYYVHVYRFLFPFPSLSLSLCLCHYRWGRLSVVQYLVEKCSADVNLIGNDGRTPLHDACW